MITAGNTARKPLHILLLAGLIAGLGACATTLPDWPQDIPPREHFSAYWEADDANQAHMRRNEYLTWVYRFYAGFNMVDGWQDMTDQVLERTPDSQHARITATLSELGRRIAEEWARDNAVRRINTRCAATWRDALIESLSQDDLFGYLARVEDDVDALLAGRLDADAIHFERYYEDDFEF